jgi:hypothetical protein
VIGSWFNCLIFIVLFFDKQTPVLSRLVEAVFMMRR